MNKEDQPLQDFHSPTFGRLTEGEMFSKLIEYIEESVDYKYNLIIGTDSCVGSDTIFVNAIVIHRVGHGGRYFYRKIRRRKMESMKQRIFYEATMSIELASVLRGKLSENGYKNLPVEI